MIFTIEQAAQIRAGRITAALLPTSEKVRPKTVKQLRRAPKQWTGSQLKRHREIIELTAPSRAAAVLAFLDGPIDTPTYRIERVCDTDNQTGERTPVLLTILAVEERWTDASTHNAEHCPDLLTDAEARQCGHFNAKAANTAWEREHPRGTPLANLVRFSQGDLRDLDEFLQYGGLAGGDYTRNRHRSIDPDAARIDARTQQRYTDQGTLKWKQQRERTLAEQQQKALADRVRVLQAAQGKSGVNLSPQLRVIRSRLSKIERKAA